MNLLLRRATILGTLLMVLVMSVPISSSTGYCGSSQITTLMEEFTYSRKLDDESALGSDFPAYDSYKLQNSCAVIAGAILLGYYDGIYDNLIPGFQSCCGRKENGDMMFRVQDKYLDEQIDRLYAMMKTNIGQSGTTITNFKTGLCQYSEESGHHVSYASVMGGRSLDLIAAQSSIIRNKPIILFLSSFKYNPSIIEKTNKDIVYYKVGTIPHALVAYGFRTVKYYRLETEKKWAPIWYNPFRFETYTIERNYQTNEYLKVSFGDGSIGYLLVNDLNIVQDAYSISIV